MAGNGDVAARYFDSFPRAGGRKRSGVFNDDTGEYWWESDAREARDAKFERSQVSRRFWDALEKEAEEKRGFDAKRSSQQIEALGADPDGRTAKSLRRTEEMGTHAESLGIGGRLVDGGATFLSGAFDLLDQGRAAAFALGEEVLSVGDDGFSTKNLKANFNERKGFGDTEVLEFKDDDEWWQRGLKAGAAFVGDTAMDPLTYLTFGVGSIGRRSAAEAADRLVGVAAKGLAATSSKKSTTALAKRTFGETGAYSRAALAAKLEEATGLQAAHLIGRKSDDLFKLALQSDVLEDVLSEGLAREAAQSMATHGTTGMRRTIRELVGDAEGDKLWDHLPGQLQGGVRASNPFSNAGKLQLRGAEDAATSAARSRITGGGKLAERLDTFAPGAGFTTALSVANKTRHLARSRRPVQWTLEHASGKLGRDYHRMVTETAQGADDIAGAGWSEYKAMMDLGRFERTMLQPLDDTVRRTAQDAIAMVKLAPDEAAARDVARTLFNGRQEFSAADGTVDIKKAAAKLGLSVEDPSLQAGAAAAMNHFQMLDELGVHMKRAFGEDVGYINEYTPRILSDEAREFNKRNTKRGGRASGNATKARKEYVEAWGLDANGQWTPTRWMDNAQINAREGRSIFVEDPFEALPKYVDSMRRVIREQLIYKEAKRTGLITDSLAAATRATLNEKNVQQAAKDTLTSFAKRQTILEEATGADELSAALQGMGDKGVRARLAAADGLIDPKKAKVDGGYMLHDRSIRKVKGGWAVDGAADGPAVFKTLKEAEAAVRATGRPEAVDNAYRTMLAERDAYLDQLANDAPTLARALDSKNMPQGSEDELETYISGLIDVIGKYSKGTELGDFKSLRPVEGYRAWFDDSGFADLAEEEISDRWRTQLEGAFSTEVVADHMRQYFQANRAGNLEALSQFVDGVWGPYYTMFKTLATVGRGPGFAARNVVGGSANAMIVGVKPKHFTAAGSMIQMQLAARHAAKRVTKGQNLEQTLEQVAKEYGDDIALQVRNRVAVTGDLLGAVSDPIYKAALRRRHGDAMTRAFEAFEVHGLHEGQDRLQELVAGGWYDELPMRARGQGQGGLFPKLKQDELTLLQRTMNKTVDNKWIEWNASLASWSEGYLRLSSFLHGAEAFGLEDGGIAASMMVKASQFDYGPAGLSEFERRVLKNVIPFYTFTRNNVPLQARALLTEPGKVAKIVRGFEDAQLALGAEEDDPRNDVLPAWMRDGNGKVLGFSIADVPLLGDLPFLKDNTDPVVLHGSSFLPQYDLNKFVKGPDEEGLLPFKFGEVMGSLNPIIKVAIETGTGKSTFTGGDLQPDSSPLMTWMPFLTDTHDGEAVGNARVANAVRGLLPPVGLVERTLGLTDRTNFRQGTSLLSSFAGLGVATLDEAQIRGEQGARQDRLENELRKTVPNYFELRPILNRELRNGTTPEQIKLRIDLLGPERYAQLYGSGS